MSDTLIFARPHAAPTQRIEPTKPQEQHRRSFAEAMKEDVEVAEAVASHQLSLLELINALLADETPPEREKLLALRAQLRRYSSEVNVLASLLSQLSRGRKD